MTGSPFSIRKNPAQRFDVQIDRRIRRAATPPANNNSGYSAYGVPGPIGDPGGTPPPTVLPNAPWFQQTATAANNGKVDVVLGLGAVYVSARMYYYAVRGTRVETGALNIWHDGTDGFVTRDITEGVDCGLTFAADYNPDPNFTLEITADNSGDPVTVRMSYSLLGLTAGAVFGHYKANRGSLIEAGVFGGSHTGIGTPYDSRRSDGDDCGLSFAADTSSGVLVITVDADSSDANDTAVSLTYLIVGRDGGTKWARTALSVSPGGSATATFELEDTGDIDWQSGTLQIVDGGSSTLYFDADSGCVHGFYYALRAAEIECGEFAAWRDATAASGARHSRLPTIGDAHLDDVGPVDAFSAAVTADVLNLTVNDYQATGDATTVLLFFIKESAI